MSEAVQETTAPGATGAPSPSLDSRRAEAVHRKMRNPFLLKLFFLAKLPLALVAGLRIRELNAERCAVSVPYGWRTQNPFRSTYFAAQSMAAELSTGALASAAVRAASHPVAMLIVDLEATFGKKATGTSTFLCEEGAALTAAVEETLRTGEPATATVETVGRMADGTEVSRFRFTWSFKRRASKPAS